MRFLALSVTLLLAFCSLLSAADPPGAKFFGLSKVHPIHVTVSAADYAAMDPPPNANPFGRPPGTPGGAPILGRPAPGSPDFGAGNFGFEFKYVHALVEVDGASLPDVGLRYKGSGTYMASQRQAKRSLKIDFDRYDAKQMLHGLKKLSLNNGVMDPTKVREALAYRVFELAGVPAPQTALAWVSLTVPGKFDREHLGIFTVVEQIDGQFLKRHFKTSDGLLLKPEGIRGLPHFGLDPKAYAATYVPKDERPDDQWRRLVELTRLVNQADEAAFRAEIGRYLDLDSFARFAAANTLLSSMDGFFGMGHNYYLYLVPETGRFTFIPWDLDLAFGAFPFFGSPQQLVNLSIDHPHVGENKLIDRLLAMPEWRAAYREQLARLASEVFTREKLGREAAEVEDLLKPSMLKERAAAEARKETGGFGMGGPGGMFAATPVQQFIERRAASVKSQLEGKGPGYVPAPGFGGPGGPGGPGPGGIPPGVQLSRPLLTALDVDRDGRLSEEEVVAGLKRLFREWDKDAGGSLDQRELAEGLQRLLPTPGQPPRP